MAEQEDKIDGELAHLASLAVVDDTQSPLSSDVADPQLKPTSDVIGEGGHDLATAYYMATDPRLRSFAGSRFSGEIQCTTHSVTKRSLFRRALSHYADESVRERVTRLEGSFPPSEAIEGFLREIVERSVKDKQRRGCMLVNSALEMAPHDSEFQEIIAGVLTEIEVFFRRLVAAGQADGTIATARSPDDLARLLLGVRVLARTRPQRKLLEGMIEPVLGLLRVPKRSRKK